jgi:sulfite reductase alpha subunit-like flavoprotein
VQHILEFDLAPIVARLLTEKPSSMVLVAGRADQMPRDVGTVLSRILQQYGASPGCNTTLDRAAGE